MTDSSAYFISRFPAAYQEKASVRGPTRPANIIRTMASFCISPSFGVTPIERPTVPKAETVSKRYSTKRWRLCDRRQIPLAAQKRSTEVIRQIEKADAKMIVIVRPRISRGICRFITFTWWLPFIRFQIISSRSVKLVVLIPPPVDPGEAPMNIRIIMTRIVVLARLPMSTVLKPAVRGVIDWKRESSSRVCQGASLQDMIRLEEVKKGGARQDQEARGHQDDLRMKREPLLMSPEPRDHFVLDDETDPPQDDERHHREIDEPVAPVRHQVVREERVAAVVEGRDGVVQGVEEGRGRREIPGEADEQEDRPRGLDDEGEAEDRLGDDEEIAARRVEKGGLDDLPSLEGDPPPHQPEQDDGEGDDPEPPDLEQDQGYDLTGQGEILPDIDDGQTRHADRRRGGEEGVDETQMPPARRKGHPEQERPRSGSAAAKLRMNIRGGVRWRKTAVRMGWNILIGPRSGESGLAISGGTGGAIPAPRLSGPSFRRSGGSSPGGSLRR